jgi:hypothetical protein
MFGPIYFKSRSNGNLMSFRDADREDRAAIVSAPKSGGDTRHQRWSMEPAGSGWHYIRNHLNGHALGTVEADPSEGARLVSVPRKQDSANQLWGIVAPGGGVFQLKHKQTGLVIDVQDGELVLRPLKKPSAGSQLWSYIAAPGSAQPPKPEGAPGTRFFCPPGPMTRCCPGPCWPCPWPSWPWPCWPCWPS